MRPDTISKLLHRVRASCTRPAFLRLRTKLLLSLVLIIAGLTSATLLIVRRATESQIQKGIEKDTRNSILTFQNLRAERQLKLSREAEILATLPSVKALMTDQDSTSVREESEEIWRSGERDLVLLADWKGKVVALRTAAPGFSESDAEVMLRRSQGNSGDGGWWFGHGHLYQVAVHAIQIGAPSENLRLGNAVVGREIDTEVVRDVAKIALCQAVFRYGDEIVASSFSLLDGRITASELQDSRQSEEIQLGTERYMAGSVNLTPGLSPAVTLIVLKSYSDAAAFISRLNSILIGLGILAICAGAALVFLISRTFTRPLEKLVAGVRALEQGDFSFPLETQSGDEVAEVTAAFDRMRTTLQQNEQRLRQSQKMEAVGKLAGGVAHDFNNLLTVIKGHSDLLQEKLESLNPLQHSIMQVKKAADRATSLTRQLLAFSRMQVLQPKILDLNSLITDTSKMLPMLIGEDIEFAFHPGDSLGQVKADPSQIEQVLLNLAVNARDAMPQGGKLTIETQNVVLDSEYAKNHPPVEPGRYVRLVVADTGAGMDAQTQARIFEPFFTTKELGKGTGLGLATVYGVVKQSGGYIWVDSTPGNGTSFEIFLPQRGEHVETSPASEVPVSAAPGSATVLLAEDEEAVRELAAEFLRVQGYTVLLAKDGVEALEIMGQQNRKIHLLITDVVMPRMRGTELAQGLARSHPEIKIIYMSGYLEHASPAGSYVAESAFLQKPFSRETLLHKVTEILGNETLQFAGGIKGRESGHHGTL